MLLKTRLHTQHPNKYLRANQKMRRDIDEGVTAEYDRKIIELDKDGLRIDTEIIAARREQTALRRRLRHLSEAGRNIKNLDDPAIFNLVNRLKNVDNQLCELGYELADYWEFRRQLREACFARKESLTNACRKSPEYRENLEIGHAEENQLFRAKKEPK